MSKLLEQLKVARLDQNLQYEIYIAEIFPKWMSFVPGGLIYPVSLREDELDAHIQHWASFTEDLINRSKGLHILLDGRPCGDLIFSRTVAQVLELYSNGTTIRRLRNRWKDCAVCIDINPADELWRKEKFGKDEWERFRQAVTRYINK